MTKLEREKALLFDLSTNRQFINLFDENHFHFIKSDNMIGITNKGSYYINYTDIRLHLQGENVINIEIVNNIFGNSIKNILNDDSTEKSIMYIKDVFKDYEINIFKRNIQHKK